MYTFNDICPWHPAAPDALSTPTSKWTLILRVRQNSFCCVTAACLPLVLFRLSPLHLRRASWSAISAACLPFCALLKIWTDWIFGRSLFLCSIFQLLVFCMTAHVWPCRYLTWFCRRFLVNLSAFCPQLRDCRDLYLLEWQLNIILFIRCVALGSLPETFWRFRHEKSHFVQSGSSFFK